MFRDLQASEIECRVATVNKKGCSLLLYKDSRCDMNLLDETVGAMNWQRKHCRENHNCIISIWDENKLQWIEKEDTGTESYTEAEKGLASDSFKRAGFNWGIGRELYTAPFIWVNLNETEMYQKEGKYKVSPKTKFSVKDIKIEDKKIIELSIIDGNNNIRYSFPTKNKPYSSTPQQSFNEFAEQAAPTIEECNKYIDSQVWSDQKKEAMKKSAANNPILRGRIMSGDVK